MPSYYVSPFAFGQKGQIHNENFFLNPNVYEYTYRLATKEQRELINLNDFKSEIEDFFQKTLGVFFLGISLTQDSYTLTTTLKLSNGNKRYLGKHFANETSLRRAVKHYMYNEGEGKSGQLFRIVK